MDDNKCTVLVAALSAYADLLAKNIQLDLEQGKGKSTVSEDDVDLDEDVRNQIAICSELTQTITSDTEWEDGHGGEEEVQAEDVSWWSLWSQSEPKEDRRSMKRKGRSIEIEEEEELLDPFTGRPIIAKMGLRLVLLIEHLHHCGY